MKITFIGGDARMRTVANLFRRAGESVRSLCLPAGAPGPVHCLFDAMQGAEAVILPLPVTRDGLYPAVSAEGEETPPLLADIFSRAEEECLFLGGMPSPALFALAREKDAHLVDYYCGEELLQRNAAATAEAAVALCTLALPCTLFDCPVAVIGGGRIAQELVLRLVPMGARVLALARSPAQRRRMEAAGATVAPIPQDGSPLLLPPVRAVLCTVPAPLFMGDAVAALSPGTLFYDLGGGAIDRDAALCRGVLLPSSTGLPGKYSPESAGVFLYEAIRERLGCRKEEPL